RLSTGRPGPGPRRRRRSNGARRRGPAGPRRVTCGRYSSRASAQAELPRAGSTRAPALAGLDQLGHPELLLAGDVGRVAGTAVGLPGALRDLRPTPVAVAGVDRPVAARLALGEAVPDGAAARARLRHGRGIRRPARAAARGRAAVAAALARRGRRRGGGRGRRLPLGVLTRGAQRVQVDLLAREDEVRVLDAV